MKDGGASSAPSFYYIWKGIDNVKIKICKIVTGVPVLPIVVGSPAMIYHQGHVTRTTDVVDVYRKSVTEIRFETRRTMYILKIDSTDIKEEYEQYGNARKAHD